MNKNFQNDFNSEIDDVIQSIERVLRAVPRGKTQKQEAARVEVEEAVSRTIAGLQCMKNDYIVIDVLGLIDGLKVKIIQCAGYVNDSADRKDHSRNHTNYGIITNAAHTLHQLGVSAEIACWQDENGYLKVPQVTIDGKVTECHNGK